MKIKEDQTIGELVAMDYRTASVFEKYKIDFCCKGDRSLSQVCREQDIEPVELLQKIKAIQKNVKSDTTEFRSWPLDLLADYIEKKHHRYVDEKIPVLKRFMEKLCQVHGTHHPELFEIRDQFNASAGELTAHMKKEEFILFPYVRKMVKVRQRGEPLGQPHFGMVINPIKSMMTEHDHEGERYRKISELSNDYTPPEDACNTYKVTYATLKEFEDDLHFHIHLENNILFPKAIELENQMEIEEIK